MQFSNYLTFLCLAFSMAVFAKPIPDNAINEVAKLVARGEWNNGSPTCDKPEEVTEDEWESMTK